MRRKRRGGGKGGREGGRTRKSRPSLPSLPLSSLESRLSNYKTMRRDSEESWLNGVKKNYGASKREGRKKERANEFVTHLAHIREENVAVKCRGDGTKERRKGARELKLRKNIRRPSCQVGRARGGREHCWLLGRREAQAMYGNEFEHYTSQHGSH